MRLRARAAVALLHLTQKLQKMGIVALVDPWRVSQVNGHYPQRRDVVSD
jgi:hypothetical protein